jgi:hypothetical protein
MVVAVEDLTKLVSGQGADIKPIFQVVLNNSLPIDFGTRIKGALVPAASEIFVNDVVGLVTTQVHPEVFVKWSVTTKKEGITLTESGTGFSYHSNNNLFGPLLDVALAPPKTLLQELTENNMNYDPIVVKIHAQIKLKALGTETQWLDLPINLEVPIRPILIPTIAAFFLEENFQGPCLMLVPTNSSMFFSEDIVQALQLVLDAFTAIQSVPYFADNLQYGTPLAWISRVLNLLKSRQVSINIRLSDKEPALNNRDLMLGLLNDIEAEDTLNSLIFISVGKIVVGSTGVGSGGGPRLPAAFRRGELAGGTYYDTLLCYYHTDYEGPYFEVRAKNAICAAVRSFRKPLYSMVKGSEVKVRKEPPAKIPMVSMPTGGHPRGAGYMVQYIDNPKYFNSELSSVKMALVLSKTEREEIVEPVVP